MSHLRFICTLFGALVVPALAQDMTNSDNPPARPGIAFYRWQEEWSVLADPRTPREPFYALKYIRMSPTEPKTYYSLGANCPPASSRVSPHDY